jgi:hypothetical protein
LIFDRTFSCYADDLAAELRNRPEYVRYNWALGACPK